MSIEYFVEGEVNIQSGGGYSVKSNEIIANNAGESVNQKGIETGVIL